MPQIFSLGPDELWELEGEIYGPCKNLEVIVYDYTNEGYEGYGDLIGFDGKNYYHAYLGHCSCYGPLDDFNLNNPIPNLIALKEKITGENFNTKEGNKLINKLKEVLSK